MSRARRRPAVRRALIAAALIAPLAGATIIATPVPPPPVNCPEPMQLCYAVSAEPPLHNRVRVADRPLRNVPAHVGRWMAPGERAYPVRFVDQPKGTEPHPTAEYVVLLVRPGATRGTLVQTAGWEPGRIAIIDPRRTDILVEDGSYGLIDRESGRGPMAVRDQRSGRYILHAPNSEFAYREWRKGTNSCDYGPTIMPKPSPALLRRWAVRMDAERRACSDHRRHWRVRLHRALA